MSEQPPTEYASPGWFPDPTGRQAQRWWDGTQWGHQTRPLPGTEQESQPLFLLQAYDRQPGPPSGHRGWPARKSWLRRDKVLAVLVSLAALVIVIGGIASTSGNAKTADNASAVAVTTPTRMATPSRAPTHHAMGSKTVPTKAPVTAQPRIPAPAAPTAPASAVAPSLPAATTSPGCRAHRYEDFCYKPGEHCRWSHYGMNGVPGDGKFMCGHHHGWRWWDQG